MPTVIEIPIIFSLVANERKTKIEKPRGILLKDRCFEWGNQ